ncbi:MAG: cytochrome b [Caldilineaceae bacterium]|nr:cytochrome b [Caldilineaceae bacterium]
MRWKNTSTHYGAVTKMFHWLVFLIFANQYIVAFAMLGIEQHETALGGFRQGTLYNWHKSIGLIALLVILFRYTWRKTTRLPNWAETLTRTERRIIHWYERILYIAMFIMPISGYLYVMAGNYGVHFFSRVHLPNPIPQSEILAALARWTHIGTAWLILIVLAVHVGLVLKHQLIQRDGLLRRMLPFV